MALSTTYLGLAQIDRSTEASSTLVGSWIDDISGINKVNNMQIIDTAFNDLNQTKLNIDMSNVDNAAFKDKVTEVGADSSWGGITGDINAQSDLMSLLDRKVERIVPIRDGNIANVTGNGDFADSGRNFGVGITPNSTTNDIANAKDVFEYVQQSLTMHSDYQGMFDVFGSVAQVQAYTPASNSEVAIAYQGTIDNVTNVLKGTYNGTSWTFADVVPTETNGSWIFTKKWLGDGNGAFSLAIYKTSRGFNLIANPIDILPTSYVQGCYISPDDQYMAVGLFETPYLYLYKRSGNTFVKLNDVSLKPTGIVNECAWSPDSNVLVCAHDVSPYVSVYSKTSDTLFSLTNSVISAVDSPQSDAKTVSYSGNGTYIAIGTTSLPGIYIYMYNGSTYDKLNVGTNDINNVVDCAFSNDGIYLAVARRSGRPVDLLFHGDDPTIFVRVSSPVGPSLAQSPTSCEFSPSGLYLFVTVKNSYDGYLFIRTDETTYERIADVGGGGGQAGTEDCAWSPDGQYLAIAGFGQESATVYHVNGSSLSKFVELSMSGLPLGVSVQFTSDSRYLVVGLNDSPYVIEYELISANSFDVAPFSMFEPDNIDITVDNAGRLTLKDKSIDTLTGGTKQVLNDVTADNIAFNSSMTIDQMVNYNNGIAVHIDGNENIYGDKIFRDTIYMYNGITTADTGTNISNAEFRYLDGVTSNIQTQLNSKLSSADGAASTIVSSNLTANRALVSNASGKVAVSAITSTELGYLDGVTSSIQTQLNSKLSAATGAASTIVSNNLTTSRALISDTSGKVAVSAVTATELGYLDGVTSAIQSQLDSRVTTNTTQTISGTKTFTAATITFNGDAVTAAATDYSTTKFRNIYFTTTDMTPGSTALPSGSICLVYE